MLMNKKRIKHKRNTLLGSISSFFCCAFVLTGFVIVYNNSPRNYAPQEQDNTQSFNQMIQRVSYTEEKPELIQTVETTKSVDEKEVSCLSKNLFFEARSGGWDEMVRVANVTINRTKYSEYPESVCATVYQPKQFSWTMIKSNTIYRIKALIAQSDGEREAWQEAQKIARLAVERQLPDRTHGAIAYHARYIHKPNSAFWHNVRLASATDYHLYYKY